MGKDYNETLCVFVIGGNGCVLFRDQTWQLWRGERLGP